MTSTRARRLLRISRTPPVCVERDATVRDAIREMVTQRVGGIAVVESDTLVGVLTERDLMVKIMDKGLASDDVRLEDVMTKDPVTVPATASRRAALKLMLENHCRHLPVVDDRGVMKGMLSIRHLYRDRVRRLKGEMRSMAAYMGADGFGG